MKLRKEFRDFEHGENFHPNTWEIVKKLYESGLNTYAKLLLNERTAEKLAAAYLQDIIDNDEEAILLVQRFGKELCRFVAEFNNKAEKEIVPSELHKAIIQVISDDEDHDNKFFTLITEMLYAVHDELSTEARNEREKIERARDVGVEFHSGLPFAWAGAL